MNRLALAILLFCLLLPAPAPAQELPRATLRVGGATLNVALAENSPARYHGLSDTPGLCPDCGMYFVYQDRATRFFVMRNMRYPLDFIWIDSGRVVALTIGAPPEGDDAKAVYPSPQPVTQVLEVNAGYCAAHNIRIGDPVRLDKPAN